MPQIGGLNIPDHLLPGAPTPTPQPRPGLGAVFSAAAKGTYGQVRYGLPYAAEKLAQTLSPQDEAFYKAGLERAAVDSSKAAPAGLADLTGGKVGIARFVAENLTASLPQMAGTIAGGVGGGLLGGPGGAILGAVAAGTPAFVGSNVGRVVQEKGGLSSQGAARSLINAVPQSASDVLVERYLPGIGKLMGGGFAAHQTGNFIARTAKSILKAGGVEAVTEAGQQLGERQAAGLDLTGPAAAAEYVNAAVTAFAVGGTLGVGGGFRRSPAHIKPASEVTTEDLAGANNDILGIGQPPAQPGAPPGAQPVGEQQLGFDLPGGSAVESQPNLPFQDAPVAEQLPSQFPQLPLNPALSAVPSNTQLELGQRFNDNVTPADLPDLGARALSPELEERLAALRNPRQSFDGIPQNLRNTPAALDPQAAIDALQGDTSSRALEAFRVPGFNGISNLVEATTNPRLFAGESIDDLNKAVSAKDAPADVKDHVRTELASRYQEAAGVEPLTTKDFQTRLTDVKSGLRGGFVEKLAADTPTELVDKVYSELFENQNTASNVVKLGQRLGLMDEKLEPTARAAEIEQSRLAVTQAEADPSTPMGTPTATAPTDVSAAVAAAPVDTSVATDPDGGSVKPWAEMDVSERVAFRKANPGLTSVPEAAAATAAPTATNDTTAAPIAATPAVVDPAFTPEWEKLQASLGQDRKSAGAKKLFEQVGQPANLQDAQAKVLRALATDTSSAAVTPAEKLAQKMGLISNDGARDITPLGRQAYLGTPEAQQESASVKAAQGIAGTSATAFDAGAREVASGEPSTASYTSFEDLAAHEAGRVWAKDVIQSSTATRDQTRAVLARQEGRVTGKAVDKTTVERAKLTPEQLQQQSLNNTLDKADLRSVPDTDVIALRKMIRDGADAATVGKALQAAQGGTTLFTQPDSVARIPSPGPSRGQPIFKEMNTQDRGPSKAQMRAELEEQQRTFDLRWLVNERRKAGDITLARAEKLNDMLDDGKVDEVDRIIDPPLSTRDAPARLYIGDGGILGGADLQLEQALTGKTFEEAMQHMVDHAPSKAMGAIMERVQAMMKKVATAGGNFDIHIIKDGDPAPDAMNDHDVRGMTRVNKVPALSTVWLKSAEASFSEGVNYQTTAHEMIHAVTMQAFDYARLRDPEGKTSLGRAALDLRDLTRSVVAHLNERLDGPRMEHTRFELAAALDEHNAFDNAHEMLAWGLTNPDMQAYLQTIEYKPRQTVFGRFVDIVRSLLGLEGTKYNTALTELLRVSEQMFGATTRELQPAFARASWDGANMSPLEASQRAADISAANRTVDATNDVTKQAAALAAAAVEKIDVKNLQGKAQRAVLGVISQNQMDRAYGDMLPAMLDRSNAKRQRDAINARIATLGAQAMQGYDRLKNDNPKHAEWVGELMTMTTEHQLDPFKAFDAHEHLVDDPNIEALRALHKEVVKIKDDLSRGNGAGIKVFNDFRAHNEMQSYAHLATELHRTVAYDPELTLGVVGAVVNPADTFMLQSNLVTQQQVRDHWLAALNEQVAAATAFVQRKKGESGTGSDSDLRAMQQHLAPIESQIADTHAAMAGMAKAPYFHLGRFGDSYASATIKLNEDGTVNAAARDHVREELLKAGFTTIRLSEGNTQGKISSRFEKEGQAVAFGRLALKLQAEGYLTDDKVQTGPVDRSNDYGVASGLPAYINKYIEAIKLDPTYVPTDGATSAERAALAQQRDKAVRLAIDTWVAGQPDSAIGKVFTKRFTRPGFDPDMVRSFAHRSVIGAANIARVSVEAKLSKADADMRSTLADAREVRSPESIAKEIAAVQATPGLSPEAVAEKVAAIQRAAAADPFTLSNVVNELKKRDALNPVNEIADTFDAARAISHSYFLGFSPAYGMINLSQLGVTGLPELAKKNGYAKSFHAMRRASGQAFAIMKAVAAEARALGPKHYADVVLTDSALQKAGLSPRDIEFMRHMIATGTLDIGTAARSFGQTAKTGASRGVLDTYLSYASAMGLYTETFSRMVMALSAHDLHGGNVQESAKYATNVVSNSMFDYQSWNTARQLGKQGFLGPATPIVAQFMSYTVQVTEKIYSEAASAFARPRPGESAEATAQRAKESRAWLVGHLTAVTALSGTLGLPFATAFASAIERMVGDDDEPYDATASYRNFLASVFGNDVAAVISRGLPRAAGFDISSRTGEQDLLPFSTLLSDKRSWKEAIPAAIGQSAGAAPSMLINMATAGEKFGQGDYAAGVEALVPIAFKGPVKAYRMSSEGYTDSRGGKLPISPKASAYLYQLLGFNPADKAEYSEARGDQRTRQLQLTARARTLRQQIIGAMLTGDHESAGDLVQKAQAFDAANPDSAIIPGLGAALQRQQTSQAQARALKTPLGVKIGDLAGQRLTGYANINY